MPGDNDATDHKGHFPPFTPPKFNWAQDNLYEQFKSFKRVVEFAFQWQYEKFKWNQMWFYLELAWG